MIDIWMLFTMTIPFIEVVLYTTQEVYKGPEKWVNVIKIKPESELESEEIPKTGCSMNPTVRLTGHLMLPAVSLIFTIVFWVVGLIKSFSSEDNMNPNMFECLTIDLN